jgi:hypothetical protein
LLERLVELAAPRPGPAAGHPGRVLDSGVEAHVHGPIDLRRDVERLVADPSFDGTATGEVLAEICRKYEIGLEWHGGFVMRVSDVPDDFRGPEMRPLAERISSDGTISAVVIGAAEASLHQRPDDWRDWGAKDETLQHLKQLWHVLVHHGTPLGAGARRSS